jgi:hypothetical protein
VGTNILQKPNAQIFPAKEVLKMEADDSYFSQTITLHKKHNAPALEMEQETQCT